jgi:hypothetical protein
LALPSQSNIVGTTPNNSGHLQWAGNSSGDGGGYTTLRLVPDDTRESSDQYLIVDPTAPGHIHIRAGGTQDNSGAQLFLGGENSYFLVENGANSNVYVASNSNQWKFDTTGVLTLPGEGVLQSLNDTVTLSSLNTTTGNANSVYLGSSGGLGFFDQEAGGNWLEIFRNGAEPEIRVPVGRGNLNIQTASGNTPYNWTFDDTGNLTLPGGGNLVFSSTQVQSSAYAGGNGHAMMIDTNRTDTYEANGSADKPFKTFAAAIAAVATLNPTGTVPYTFILMGCNINETVDFTPYNFNFITISTTCRSVFNDPVIFGNSDLLQLTVRNVEFGDTVTITGDGTTNQLNNTSFYNTSFTGALTVTAANSLAFYEAAFFSTVTFNNVNYVYVNGGQFNSDWTIRADNSGAYPVPSNGITPGQIIALDFIANNIIFVKGGTGTYVFQPQGSRMGLSAGTYTLPAGWTLSAYSSVFRGTWTNNGTWTMRNSSNDNAIANVAPTYSGTIGGTTISISGNIVTGGQIQSSAFTGGNISWSANSRVDFQGAIKVGGTGQILSPGGAASITLNNNGANIPILGVTNTSNSTSTTTGALIVSGGAGVAGNVYVGGNIVGNTAGFAIGYRDIPQVSFTGNATIATTDAGKHFYSTQSSNFTLTIANNASQGFQVGAAITVVNQGTGTITIAQGSGVTLYLAGNATSGNRSVSTFGMATIMKVATDTWFINGTGVS